MHARALVLALAAWSLSCGSGQKPKRPVPDPAAPSYVITAWIEPDPRMPKDFVLEGCAKWKDVKVTCVEVADKAMARMRIYADDGECRELDPKDGKLHTILAWAHSGGDIRMMMKCMRHDAAGAYARKPFAGVVGHEVGHQLGIWEHVPEADACKDAKRHPSGRPVCGQAIMNAYYSDEVDYVTEIDKLAFDLRDTKYSVVTDEPRAHPDCIFRLPEPAP